MSFNLSNKNILVIGDLMLDHYIYGNCNRISPEAPVPVVEITRESYTLGGAGNVLKNLNAFGCSADIISVVGDDEYASILVKQLKQYQIGEHGIVADPDRCTIIKSRVLATNHQLIRLDREITTPLSTVKEREIVSHFRKIIDQFDILLISDYNKGFLSPSLLKEIIAICREKNIFCIVDPKGTDFSKYYGADIIKPNRKEASIATGIPITDNASLESVCRRMKEITGCEHVIITMSEDGMAIFSEDNLSIIPTQAQDVVDVTGAGDTVLAALGIALAAGKSLKESCEFANQAAAIVVNKVGTATVTLEEIQQKLGNIA